jgi:hypothetical protein
VFKKDEFGVWIQFRHGHLFRDSQSDQTMQKFSVLEVVSELRPQIEVNARFAHKRKTLK